MEVYFNLLPEELNHVIFSYLDYENILEIKNVITFQINFNILFSVTYKDYYNNFKTLFKYDKKLSIYQNMSELFYLEYTTKNMITIDQNCITTDLTFRSLILKDYPLFYKYIDIFDEIYKLYSYSFDIWATLNDINKYSKADLRCGNFIKKFLKGENMSEEECSNEEDFDISKFTSNPDLLYIMMLEGDFLPKIFKRTVLFTIDCYVEERKTRSFYDIMIKKLYKYYKKLLSENE